MDMQQDELYEPDSREQAKLIRRLDSKNVKCKQFLTRSFRHLDKLVNKKRNYTLTHSHQTIIDDILEYAKVIKPYSYPQMFQKGPISSKSFFDQYVAHRRCFKAKVIIDGQVIVQDNFNQYHFSSDEQRSIFKNGSFNLTIQSQTNTTICYTTNGEHPLLTNQFQQISNNRQTRTLQPPQHLNIIVKGFQRIESHLVTIIVKQSRNGEPSTSSQGMHNRGVVIRPNNNDIFDESRQISQSFKNIDNSSFLQ